MQNLHFLCEIKIKILTKIIKKVTTYVVIQQSTMTIIGADTPKTQACSKNCACKRPPPLHIQRLHTIQENTQKCKNKKKKNSD